MLCQETGNTDAAHRNYQLASRMAPGNIKLGMHWASMYEHQGLFSQAALLYDVLHYLLAEEY